MQAHGHFEMQRQGQLLICRPSGPFNLAGAMAYEGKFSQQISCLQGAPGGIVEVATEFEAAGPEVLARFRRQFNWCATHGCAFLAVVMIGDFKRYLADHVFSELPFRRCAISRRKRRYPLADTAPRGAARQGEPRQHGLNIPFIPA